MITIADKNNWVVSTISALVLHIGILIALVSQMNAGISQKRQTEISILSIPSTSNAVPVNSTTIVRPVAVSNSLSQSSIKHDRLATQVPDATKAKAAKTFEKATVSQPVELAALDAAGASENVAISNNPRPLTGTSDIKAVDTVKPDLAKPVRDTAEKLKEASDTAATLARTRNEYIQDSGKNTVHARLNSSQNQQRAKILPLSASVARSSATLKRVEPASPSPLKPRTLPVARKMEAATGVIITPVAVKAPIPTAVIVQRQPAISTATNSPIIKNHAQKSRTDIHHGRLEPTRGQKPVPTAVVTITPQRRAIVSTAQFDKSAKTKKQLVAASKQKKARKLVRIAKIRIGPANTVAAIRPETVLSPDKRTDNTKLTQLIRPNQTRLRDQRNNAQSNRRKIGKLLTYLKFQEEDNCFVALPTITKKGQPELVGFGRSERPWSQFLDGITHTTKLAVPSRLAKISAHQCQVTSFIHGSSAYPSFTITLALQNNIIKTGDFLAGSLLNINGRHLNLLLIDDEGTAQLLNNFVTTGDDRSHFFNSTEQYRQSHINISTSFGNRYRRSFGECQIFRSHARHIPARGHGI